MESLLAAAPADAFVIGGSSVYQALLVEGFEKQLDRLFQGDVMDITTDVEVLERMLAKDGLSDQEGLTLGL